MKPHHKKEFRHIREVVLWLYNFECHNCNQINLQCEVHHLDKDNLNNDISNLAPLCPNCHKLYHRVCKQTQVSKGKIVWYLLKKIDFFKKSM